MSLSLGHHFTDLPVHIFIGPEGGFTKDETTLAESIGFIITSLGKRILRAETAAISAMTLVQFLLGDLG
jgi:16S rRNA (uracil1498-N3)-methyltransferase